MIAKALCKYRLIYSLTSKQFTPLFRCFSPADGHLFRPLFVSSSRCSSTHNRKMIGMRRGLWGKDPRQNQTDSRGNFNFWNNSYTDYAAVTSTSGTLESMPADEETVVHPVAKRAKLDKEMPTNNVLVEQTPVKPVLRFKKLTNEAKAPTRGSEVAAGYDMYSAYEYVIPAGGKEKVLTDIAIEVPEGCYGRVAPRSGLAWKNSIDVGAGVIDRDYRGNIGVILFNLGKEDFKVEKEMRIAQLICERICYPELEEVIELEKTTRGSNGYGSTGTK